MYAAPMKSAEICVAVKFRRWKYRSGKGGAGKTEDEHTPLAVEVAHLPEDGKNDGRREHGSRDDPRKDGLRSTEVASDVTERDDQYRDGERRREHPGESDDEDPPPVVGAALEARAKA